MQIYISILWGINVSGKNLIKMNLLKELYESLGFSPAITYIQSGNVVFRANQMPPAELEKIITAAIATKFLFTIPVIVIEPAELKAIVAQNPFTTKRSEDIEKLHITFLSQSPKLESINLLNSNTYLPDELFISEKAVYLFCPNGYGRTKLTNTFFENKLKVSATTRNMKTAMELLRISETIIG